ncbi:MAG: HD domain-containing protein [Candidatus Wolfebacteria bacterium]|nr:HD domain-containing protein [Candidatus Wolfebacteria bacterium]
MKKLFGIIQFSKLLQDFSKIERVILKRGENKWENDSEHSYGLTMLAWYIMETDKIKLKKDLVLKYALAHDLVEVYAGDTYFFSTDENHETKKFAREKKAAERLKKEFPGFKELHSSIKKYEERNDPESRFVYALDKVIPMLNIYTDNGRTWKKKNVTIKMLVDKKKDKVALSPAIEKYFWELIKILKKEKARLFNK